MSSEYVALAAHLYADFISPLVLGGTLRPGRPIGGAAAVSLAKYSQTVDADLRSRTDLGRAKVARELLAIDVVPEASAHDWTLLACIHDWVVAASPELPSMFSRRAGDRLVELTSGTLEYVAPTANVSEALSRHTFLSRLFDVQRKDVKVSFWAGARTFLGTKPPPRLLAWPDLRRVRTETTPRELVHLAEHGARVDREQWLALFERMLRRSPLTDLATVTRESPTFAWSKESLGLASTPWGQKLALRALKRHDRRDVLIAIGRATRLLRTGEAWRALSVAADLLGALVLDLALESTVGEWSHFVAEGERSRDLFFATAFGAHTAARAAEETLPTLDARAALVRVLPIAKSAEAQALLPAGT